MKTAPLLIGLLLAGGAVAQMPVTDVGNQSGQSLRGLKGRPLDVALASQLAALEEIGGLIGRSGRILKSDALRRAASELDREAAASVNVWQSALQAGWRAKISRGHTAMVTADLFSLTAAPPKSEREWTIRALVQQNAVIERCRLLLSKGTAKPLKDAAAKRLQPVIARMLALRQALRSVDSRL